MTTTDKKRIVREVLRPIKEHWECGEFVSERMRCGGYMQAPEHYERPGPIWHQCSGCGRREESDVAYPRIVHLSEGTL